MTEAWGLYEQGKLYNNSLIPNQYDLVNTNIEFFVGNQWKGLSQSSAMAALPKPVFNIIKRVASLFVASLCSSSSKVTFEPLTNKPESPITPDGQLEESDDTVESMKAAEMATSEVDNLFDKLKMDARIREAMFDGAQTGDYCAHFYWDPHAKPYGGAYSAYRGEIRMELVDGINIMFGNPNTPIVEDQPYILVIGRGLVKDLCEEYKQHHGGSDIAADVIQTDHDTEWQAASGGKTEIWGFDRKMNGKCLYMYFYTKKTKKVKLFNEDGTPKMTNAVDEAGQFIQEKTPDGFPMIDAMGNPVYKQEQAVEYKTTVHVSKHTKYATIFDEVDTGLTYYPIAWGNWERQKNQYHGRALVTGIIPNQIYINSMFALIMRHQQMLGFPKIFYDANIIGHWSNTVGQAIGVYDLPPDKRMSDLYGVIQPADMSTQIMRCIEMAMQYTKECLGATDAQLGNVRPDNTSALIALQSSSQVPLENPQANKYEWVEDVGRILLDMMGTYYGQRPVVKHEEVTKEVTDPTTGMPTTMIESRKVIEMYDFSKLKNLWLNVRADVGASTYWSRIAVVQTLDNLKQSGVLDVIDYLERMPDEYIPRKEELIAKLRKQIDSQSEQPAPGLEFGPEADPIRPGRADGASPGVAFGANTPDNEAAVIATMPPNIQQQYNTMGSRVKKALLQQTELATPGV